MALAPGAHLGSYELLRVLGAGGMGEVYAARDLQLKRQVAIKVLPPEVAGDPSRLARFEREAQLASALNHPNIVTIYGVGRDSGVRYIVMELVEGQTLKAARAAGPWTMARTLDVGAQIATGLAKAHDAGIIHRDLKPQNIMISADGLVKILDFGLSTIGAGSDEASTATADTALTRPGAVIGTVHYMSPEQASGHPVDFRSDQFSFGSVLYELVAGRRPFDAPTAVQTLSAIISNTPAPIQTLNPDTPDAVVAVIDRCLAKAPADRYASTRDLVRALEAARTRAPSGTQEFHDRARRRRPRAVWMGAGVTAAAAIALAMPSVRARLPWPFAPPAHQQLAVLPFTTVENDAENQHFSAGLVDVLTTRLSQIARFNPALDVVPASEIRRTRTLDGSIQRSAGAIRVTINLLDATTRRMIDSRSLDLVPGDVPAMQDRVGRMAAVMVAASLPARPAETLARERTRVPHAYELYLQGRKSLRRYENLDRVNAAIQALEEAVKADPSYPLAHAALGEAYWRKWERTQKSEWSDSARASCRRALDLATDLADVQITCGIVANGTGRPDEAIAQLSRAIVIDPLDADAYRELANTYRSQRKDAEAEETYKIAIDIDPNNWANHNDLGAFYFLRRRYPEAEIAYKREIDLIPDSDQGYRNLGAVYQLTSRDDAAIAMYRKSLDARPNEQAYSNLGTMYYTQGKAEDAAHAYQQALGLNDHNGQIWWNLASAQYWLPGQREASLVSYARALPLIDEKLRDNPRDIRLLVSTADCESRLGHPARARDLLARALSLSPPDANVMAKIGTIYEQIGERAAALDWIAKALANGYSREAIERSPDLRALRADKRFTH